MSAPQEIIALTERFERNREAYTSGQYNETQLRREFLDPFFEALGWDVNNKKGHAEAYKDVIHEDAIKIGGYTKAPDYCFRIGGTRKFFVEAKKPSVNLKDDISPAFQLRRYAWSARLPLSILTDFEEFVVYDCRIKPDKADKSSTARILYSTFSEYQKRWDEISSIFSLDAILKGSFDKYVESGKGKKGTAEVDAAFLKEIESWRELLARNIALRNPSLTQRELNFAVQQTIDRIIFLRICEDRGMEEYGRLQSALNGANVYQRLCQLFRRADEKYNSGLFHFTREKEREEPDSLTLQLTIDDTPLKEIIKNLYYPDSPYEFSVLPADILGQVYEQFLGKVIRLTEGHRAVVEDKPEVKKAGGVYYTPTYIVDYIVKNTVGQLLGNATPLSPPVPREELKENPAIRTPQSTIRKITPKDVSKIGILDPACGSGSFLIGAFQYLIDWHLQWYSANDPESWTKKKNPPIFNSPTYQFTDSPSKNYKLTTAEKKRILLNNIYGVDIDPQAVEVTKLSLLLKVLEGESDETLSNQLKLFQERALPDLGNNIKCGNSLIGPDFYTPLTSPLGKGGQRGVEQQLFSLGDEERYRINAFDWKKEFPHIFPSPSPGEGQGEGVGGFDAVIGNPPYGFHQIHSDFTKPYFKGHIESAQGSFEHYFLFYERSLILLKKNGYHGFIVPVTWLTIPSAQALRKFILDNFYIQEICWLPELVFANAQVNTLISIIKNAPANAVKVAIYDSLGFRNSPKEMRLYDQNHFVQKNYFIGIFEKESDRDILDKLINCSQALGKIARPCSGYNPYEVGKGFALNGGPQKQETVETKPYHSMKRLSDEWKPEIVGRDLRRYFLDITGNRWVKYGHWLAAPRDPNNFIGKRILVQEITGGKEKRIIACYYDKELYYSRDVIPIKIDNEKPDSFYLLGIINSGLITWYHHKRNPKAQKGLFPKVLVSDLKSIPIRTINFSDPTDKARHDKMVSLVEQMLSLNKQLSSAKTAHEKTNLQRQIDATDKQIDNLVYEL